MVLEEACRLNSRRRNPSESIDCQELHCPNLSNLGFVSFEGWILAMYMENLAGFLLLSINASEWRMLVHVIFLWPPPASAVPAVLLGELDDRWAASSLEQRERLKGFGGRAMNTRCSVA